VENIILDNKIKVYAKVAANTIIKDINSSIFLNSTDGYVCIDEGIGDKFAHAQGSYLDKGVIDSSGRYNYKYIDNKVMELTEEEKATLFPPVTPQPTLDETLAKEVANIKLDSMKKDTVITNALKTIADLKVEIMNLKGGSV
jgi:hypothetical protein